MVVTCVACLFLELGCLCFLAVVDCLCCLILFVVLVVLAIVWFVECVL